MATPILSAPASLNSTRSWCESTVGEMSSDTGISKLARKRRQISLVSRMDRVLVSMEMQIRFTLCWRFPMASIMASRE
jgi:hypothetical protein